MAEADSSIERVSGVVINSHLTIPFSELDIRFTRSSGPGGQHVNKTSTQAELTFDLERSPSLTEADRSWLKSRLASKLDTTGVLRITSQEYRSQGRNKKDALEKFAAMLREALVRPKKRKKTKPSRSAVEKRLESKKKRGETKKLRGSKEF
jgi:ribosome-associated protein